MTGALPESVRIFAVEGARTIERQVAPRAPGPSEAVVEVAGSALGAQPGAEICGRVIAAGDGAAEWIGRRVVVPRLLPCGECDRCRRAHVASCPSLWRRGPVATHETVPARFLLAAEPPLDPGDELWRWAALADAAATPYNALTRAQVAPGDLCLVVGGGTRGRFALQIAKAKGAHPALLESDASLRELGRSAGARFLLDGELLDATAARNQLFADARAAGIERAELKVIETTSSFAGRRRAIVLVAHGGTAALLADGDGREVSGALDAVAEREAIVVGAAAGHPDLLPELAALVVRGELRLDGEVAALPFSSLAEALAQRRSGRAHVLPVLVPSR